MPYSQQSAEQFLQYYNRLDKYMRILTQSPTATPHVELLERVRKHALNRAIAHPQTIEFLKDMARLRNTIVHTPKENGEVIALPLVSAVDRYAALVERAISPPRCMDMAIARRDILCAHMDDGVLDSVRRMKKAQYSHLPILKDERVEGVFSESSLYTYFALKGELIIDHSMKIGHLGRVTDLDAHSSECFEFMSDEADMDDLLDLFQEQKHGRKRMVMVFITDRGKPNEALRGILTLWDILRYAAQGE